MEDAWTENSSQAFDAHRLYGHSLPPPWPGSAAAPATAFLPEAHGGSFAVALQGAPGAKILGAVGRGGLGSK